MVVMDSLGLSELYDSLAFKRSMHTDQIQTHYYSWSSIITLGIGTTLKCGFLALGVMYGRFLNGMFFFVEKGGKSRSNANFRTVYHSDKWEWCNVQSLALWNKNKNVLAINFKLFCLNAFLPLLSHLYSTIWFVVLI